MEHYASPLLIAALDAIGGEIWRVTNNCMPHTKNPMGNTGDKFTCDAFTAEAYDWKDEFGEEERDTPQVNFRWRDLEVEWYKYLGRGTYTNRPIKPDEIAEMLNDCLAALRDWEKKNEEIPC